MSWSPNSLPAPLFFLWNRPAVGLGMIVYALAFNLPLVAIQRYNRPRLLRIKSQRQGRDDALDLWDI